MKKTAGKGRKDSKILFQMTIFTEDLQVLCYTGAETLSWLLLLQLTGTTGR